MRPFHTNTGFMVTTSIWSNDNHGRNRSTDALEHSEPFLLNLQAAVARHRKDQGHPALKGPHATWIQVAAKCQSVLHMTHGLDPVRLHIRPTTTAMMATFPTWKVGAWRVPPL